MDAVVLAKYVIYQFSKRNKIITNLKLQKILYYIQGYYYRRFKRPAFLEDIYNWQYGPVVPKVYYLFSENHSSALSSEMYVDDSFLNMHEKELIDNVIDRCVNMSASYLVEKTHSEAPWKYSELGNIITKNSINMFFYSNDPLVIDHARTT